jgi:hypothetical protein
MVANSTIPSADTISPEAFADALAQYPKLIENIDASAGECCSHPIAYVWGMSPASLQKCTPNDLAGTAKKKSLKELDDFRYGEAVNSFGGEKPKVAMDLGHVKLLVEWKLLVYRMPLQYHLCWRD